MELKVVISLGLNSCLKFWLLIVVDIMVFFLGKLRNKRKIMFLKELLKVCFDELCSD